MQFITEDSTKPLSDEQIRQIQKAVGKFLFLVRAIDSTILHALNGIACNETKGTENTTIFHSLIQFAYILDH